MIGITRLLIVVACVVSPLTSIESVKGETNSLEISSSIFGNFSFGQEDKTISFDVTSYYLNDITVEISGKFTKGGTSYYQRNKTFGKTISCNQTCVFELVFPIKNYFSKDGMSVLLNFLINGIKETKYEYSFNLYEGKSASINPINYKNQTYRCNSSLYKFDKNNLIDVNEYFVFDDFLDYFNIDYYYQLNLDQFKFKFVSSNNNYTYLSSYLEVIGDKNCFSLINGKKIPLYLYQDLDGYLKIDFEQMYVDCKTFLMSIENKEGYVATNHFYMPINKMREANNTFFRITINGLGDCKTDLVWTCQYNCQNLLIGDCQNSEYCIVGEIIK